MMKNSLSLLPRASSRIFRPRSYVDYVRSGKNRRHSFFVLQMPILNPNYASRTTIIITPSHNNLDPVATKHISAISSFRLFTTTSYNATTHSSPVVQSRSSTSGGGRGGILPEVQTQVLDTCTDIHSSIMALNEKLRGPLPKNSDQSTALPFVLFVGNHSSGKSSFINYILQRNVQTAGVAPTDDCFTVIAPGPYDQDRDGPALIGDPDMGFRNLRQFGPTLVHHTQLKIRSSIRIQNFMLVDSPGMIDSPAGHSGGSYNNNTTTSMDRGYDFQNVVKWFAERADVVLLFFDPDKPGTTGETLKILLHALGGMDHKLLIILNKADQFKKIHDFARAYGSLCWNLSKVIPRKDIPRIYTMCLPVHKRNDFNTADTTSQIATTSTVIETNAFADLHQTRDDVLEEVLKAPERRINNVITNLHDCVSQLLMHAVVLEETRNKYDNLKRRFQIQIGGTMISGLGIAGLGTYFAVLPLPYAGGFIGATMISCAGMVWLSKSQLTEYGRSLCSSEGLSSAYQRTHMNEIRNADEYTANVWQRVRDHLKIGLESFGFEHLPSVSKKELDRMNWILETEVPRLRRLASPAHFGLRSRAHDESQTQ